MEKKVIDGNEWVLYSEEEKSLLTNLAVMAKKRRLSEVELCKHCNSSLLEVLSLEDLSNLSLDDLYYLFGLYYRPSL